MLSGCTFEAMHQSAKGRWRERERERERCGVRRTGTRVSFSRSASPAATVMPVESISTNRLISGTWSDSLRNSGRVELK